MDNGIARRHAERAAHEGEILHGDDDRQVFDGAGGVEDGVFQAGLGLRLLEAIGVALLVAELERILDDLGVFQGLVFALVEEIFQPFLGRDLHVVAGSRDDELVGFEVLVEDHLAGLGILDPQIFRHIGAPAEHRIDLRADVIGDPVHGFGSCPGRDLEQFQEDCVAVFRPELLSSK